MILTKSDPEKIFIMSHLEAYQQLTKSNTLCAKAKKSWSFCPINFEFPPTNSF